MSPDKKEIINGIKIEQYYWAGDNSVYVNNRLTDETFESACKKVANRKMQRICYAKR